MNYAPAAQFGNLNRWRRSLRGEGPPPQVGLCANCLQQGRTVLVVVFFDGDQSGGQQIWTVCLGRQIPLLTVAALTAEQNEKGFR